MSRTFWREDATIRATAALAAVVGAAYLTWRAGWTLNMDALWLALPLLLAETHGYLTFLGYTMMTWDPRPMERRSPLPHATVDFFIPTFNEQFSVLAPTIASAVAIAYPHRTYVLDDGSRPWVRRLCRRLGAAYIARPEHQDAKAGNLNYALSRTSGEFIAIVDADFVPAPDFLAEMLGYFRDPQVAFVQGPQEFFNRDSFQHLKDDAESWHEQALFFRTIQAGKNRWNAAFWCGCPSVMRRSALESVGGVAADTVTEDLHTSIRLHANGWRSVYHANTVALGIAPNDYDGFILQRLRWAQGTMQVIRKERSLRGLSIMQALNYLASTGTYFDALRKAFFLAIVPAVLLTDTLPVRADASVFLPLWALQFAFGSFANNLLGRGNNRFLMTEFFDLMKMFAFLQATLTLLSGHRVNFRVTPKSRAGERKLHKLLLPYAGLVLVYVASIAVGAMRIGGVGIHTQNPLAIAAGLLWGLAIVAFLSSVVLYGYTKVSQRNADRVPVTQDGLYRRRYGRLEYAIQLLDLTTESCAFLTAKPPPMGAVLRIRLPVEEDVAFRARVRRVMRSGDQYEIGLVIEATEAVQTKIARVVASALFGPKPREILVGRPTTLMEDHRAAA